MQRQKFSAAACISFHAWLLFGECWGAGVFICLERCRLAYGPADATAAHCLLLH